jgi:alkanesulfonate monooxygenase SsuD/methylene tetrahydromethanopterin reductase-like flavin-dependent oxidoreductase (luciferase family)
VAQYADEWNMTTNAPRVVRRGASRLADRCRAIGRDPRSIVLSVSAGVIIGSGEAELGRRCESIRHWVPDLACYASAEVIRAAHGLGWLCGTPDDVVAALRALAEEGVERVMLQHNDWDDEDVLRLLAREVLPAVVSVGIDGTRR